jgi:hypothetical protein
VLLELSTLKKIWVNKKIAYLVGLAVIVQEMVQLMLRDYVMPEHIVQLDLLCKMQQVFLSTLLERQLKAHVPKVICVLKAQMRLCLVNLELTIL